MTNEQLLNRNNSLCHKIMSRMATNKLAWKHRSKIAVKELLTNYYKAITYTFVCGVMIPLSEHQAYMRGLYN